MADDMDSDTCVRFKRTIKEIQETHTLPQHPNSPSVIPEQDTHSSLSVSPLKQDPDFINKSPYLVSDSSKKVKLSPQGQLSETHLEEIQNMPNSLSEKAKPCDLASGFPVSGGAALDFMESCEVGFVSDGVAQDFVETCKFGLASEGEFVTTETRKTLDDEKERVSSDLVYKEGEVSMMSEVGLTGSEIFNQETKSVTECDCKEGLDASMSTSVENKAFFLGKGAESQSFLELKKKQLLEEVDAILVPAEKNGSVSSFKIEVIDDTALIDAVNVPKPGNGCVKELAFAGISEGVAQRNGKKNAKQEMNRREARASKRKEKVENHNLSLKNGNGTKMMYSRMELEAMRFVNVAEQKCLWKDIYRGFGPVVAKEYDNLASVKNQKNTHNTPEPHKHLEKMEAAPGILDNMDIELENMMNNGTQDASPLDPYCSYSATDEKECSEDDDSDEDYANIQRPALAVEGEPNFESGSPEDGLEYLRRVRWEAARIPKVRVAKVDRSKFTTEQSSYMPKIPEIAKCPEQLLPLKHWEDAFLADFSELRLALSRFEDSNASTSHDPQSKFTVLEKFANVKPKEMDIQWPDGFPNLESSIGQLSLSTTKDSNASLPAQSSSDSPLLSVILRMDCVARVSMLRKHIKAVEEMSSLTRSDCVWLFALCAAVDTPLHADTSASLRSLLRKCAALRAAKSVLDNEVVMLNILATISGRYFGQSEN